MPAPFSAAFACSSAAWTFARWSAVREVSAKSASSCWLAEPALAAAASAACFAPSAACLEPAASACAVPADMPACRSAVVRPPVPCSIAVRSSFTASAWLMAP